MNTLNLTAARQADRVISIADNAILTTQNLLLRVNDSNGVCILLKTNKDTLDNDVKCTIAGTATLSITTAELDALPNSATYVLYSVGADGTVTALCGGTFTVSGDKSQQAATVGTVPFQNGSNLRIIDQEEHLDTQFFDITNDDDYINIHDDVSALLQISLPNVHTNKGKVFHIKNTTDGNPDNEVVFLNADLTLKPGEEVTLISNGSIYEIWGYKEAVAGASNLPAVSESHVMGVNEDVCAVDGVNDEVTITLPNVTGKIITVIVNNYQSGAVVIVDNNSNVIVSGCQQNKTYRFYRIDGLLGGSWMEV